MANKVKGYILETLENFPDLYVTLKMEQEDRTNLDAFPQAGLGRSSCLVASVNNAKNHYSSIVLSEKFKNLPLKQ